MPLINVSNSVTPDQVTVSVGPDPCLLCSANKISIDFADCQYIVMPREAANVVSMNFPQFEISVVSSYPRLMIIVGLQKKNR